MGSNWNSKTMKWTSQEKELLRNIWLAESRENILKQLSRSWKSIKRQAERMCLKRIRGPYGSQHKKLDSNSPKIIPSWLIGEMLSDGHIDPQGRYCHTTKHKRYAQFLKNKFTEIDVLAKIHPNQYFDKRTRKTYSRSMLRTRSVFKRLRTEWYQPLKAVPTEIRIDDEVLHHWTMGDGSIINGTFRLATMGFNDESLRILQKALLVYGLNVTVQKSRNIYIRRSVTNKQIIRELVNRRLDWNCYEYKKDGLREWSKQTTRAHN